MPKAVTLTGTGGPDSLTWSDFDPGQPGPNEVRIRQYAIGLNYIDVYHRTGLYPLPSLPAIIGMEGAGEVIAIGSEVSDIHVGERVAYAGVLGGYAEERNIAADRVVILPAAISYDTAAAMMLQGMTVRYLLRECFPTNTDTVMLFHAAAGGVGLIACQWAKAIGATLIGTAGSDEKMEIARAHGATHMINYRTESFVDRVKVLTGDTGCDVVFDSIGKDTFEQSLACLKPRGLMVSYGNASGPVPPLDLSLLQGSLFVTRPSLMAYTAQREDLLLNAKELFDMVEAGRLKIKVNQRYELKDAALAHRDLEARKTTGSTILITN